MSWAEVRNLTGALLPRYMEDDWPTPESPEFWRFVDYEEIGLFLRNQIGQYAKTSAEVRAAILKSYRLLIWPAQEELQRESGELSFLTDSAIELIFTGPMQNYFLDRLGVPRAEIGQSNFLELVEKRRNSLSELSEPEQVLLWWTVWMIAGQKSQAHRKTAVESLLKLGLRPPRII